MCWNAPLSSYERVGGSLYSAKSDHSTFFRDAVDVFGDSAEDSGVMWLEVLDNRRRDEEESLLTIRPNRLVSLVL